MSTFTDTVTELARLTFRKLAKVPLLDDILHAGEKAYMAVSRSATFNDDEAVPEGGKPSTGAKTWGFLFGTFASAAVLFGYLLISPLLLQVYLPYKITTVTKGWEAGAVAAFVVALASALFMPYLFPLVASGLGSAPIIGKLSFLFNWSASISTLFQIDQAGKIPFWEFWIPMTIGFVGAGVGAMFISTVPDGSTPLRRDTPAADMPRDDMDDTQPPAPQPGVSPHAALAAQPVPATTHSTAIPPAPAPAPADAKRAPPAKIASAGNPPSFRPAGAASDDKKGTETDKRRTEEEDDDDEDNEVKRNPGIGLIRR